MNAPPSILRPTEALPAIVPSDVSVNTPMDSPPHLPVTSAADPGDPPLTRVSLAYVEHRINLYLRFGQPLRELRLDRWRRCASFAPGAVFCRVRWESNDYGTTRWQLVVLQACTPGERMQRIAGVRPGAQLLLCADDETRVQAVLQQIDVIEALAIDPTQASPAYWRTLGNRLAARQPLPAYGTERHAAWLRGEDLR
ncbi:hypothetical protein WDL1CHR_02483 [Variovorax sp. WDL1]|nr:hypothetical protein CHC06_04916 [Variovorax sp. B2]PNG54141.1 hypothetical protein CHC07_03965 [Variovorax sp. B4]VTV11620.1 hypothetical protein WDL1CHR_02483 [Variovorax sp. WDL1]